jgi:hypothetical protein
MEDIGVKNDNVDMGDISMLSDVGSFSYDVILSPYDDVLEARGRYVLQVQIFGTTLGISRYPRGLHQR